VRTQNHVYFQEANPCYILTPNMDALFFPALQSFLFMFARSCRPIRALFSFLFFSRVLLPLPILVPIFLFYNFCLFSYLDTVPILLLLRPFWDFLLYFAFFHHIAYLGSPCILGCKPKDHASWAVAGWFTGAGVPAYGVVVVGGVWRRWRILVISSMVRVVVYGGAYGRGGGVIISPACCCFINVGWVYGG
jgi:hypothetical protein